MFKVSIVYKGYHGSKLTKAIWVKNPLIYLAFKSNISEVISNRYR